MQPCRSAPPCSAPRSPAEVHHHAMHRAARPKCTAMQCTAQPGRSAPPCNAPRSPAEVHHRAAITLIDQCDGFCRAFLSSCARGRPRFNLLSLGEISPIHNARARNRHPMTRQFFAPERQRKIGTTSEIELDGFSAHKRSRAAIRTAHTPPRRQAPHHCAFARETLLKTSEPAIARLSANTGPVNRRATTSP
jgi:hypothetical protein